MLGKKKKKLPGWLIIPIIGGIVAIVLVGNALAGGGKKEEATTFDVVKVEKGDVKETFATTGTVESEKTKVFYSPVNAKVTTLNAKVGQVVKAGAVLVTFDTTNLERDNQQSQLQQRSTELSNQDTIQQSNKAQAEAAKNASKAQQAAVDAYNELVNQQNGIVNQMNAIYANVQAEKKTNETNSPHVAEAQAKIDHANQQIQAYKDRVALIQTYTDMGKEAFDDSQAKIAEGNKELQALQAEADKLANDILYYWPNEIKTQEAIIAQYPVSTQYQDQYASLQSQYNALEGPINEASKGLDVDTPDVSTISSAQMGNMQISEDLAALASLSTEELLAKGREGMKAEFDGVIADVKAVENTDAVQGGEMYTLADMSNVDVSIEIPTEDYEKVKVGQKGTITIGSHKYNGTVQSVNQIATVNKKGTSIIGARLRIDNPDSNIFIGVSAKVSMTVAESDNTLLLPTEVVNTNTTSDFVYVIEDGVVKEKPVELGVSSGRKIEILKGLSEGDEVISDLSGDVKKGMKAKGNLTEVDD